MASIKIILGQRFGNWTVVQSSEKKALDGIYYWKCRCDCGFESEVRGQNLRNGHSKGCSRLCQIRLLDKRRISFNQNYVIAENSCWVWTGKRTKEGFGLLEKDLDAHHYSYLTFKGNIPTGLKVCHHCQNNPCVNPTYLYVK